MGTKRNEGFTIYAPEPIDSRMIAETVTALGTIPLPYNHMLVHVIEDDADYRYYSSSSSWVQQTSNGYAVWSQIDGDPEDSGSLVSYLTANYLPITYTPPPQAPEAHTHPTSDIQQTGGTYLFSSTITATNFILRSSLASEEADVAKILTIDGSTTTEDIPLGSTILFTGSEITSEESGFTVTYTETDPTVPSYVKAISQENIDQWNSALGATRTSDLINDGDGTSPYATEDYVDADSDVSSSLSDNATIANTWYTELVGEQMSTIQGMNITQLVEFMLFQTVNAYISTPVSSAIAVSGSGSDKLVEEVGTAYSWTLTGSLDQGEITDGTGLVNDNPVVGEANVTNAYTFTGTGIISPITTSSAFITRNDNIDLGNNRWDVTIAHQAGSGAYYNNRNEVGNNLDDERVSGAVTSPISDSIIGVYPYFYGMSASDFTTDGSAMYTSGEMTKLVENLGNKTVNLRGTSKRIYYAFPASYPILTRILDGNDDNVINSFNVDDVLLTSVGLGANWSVSYKVYSSLITTVDNDGSSVPYNFIHSG